MEERIKRLRETKATAALGGGEQKITREHEKGKLTARERIDHSSIQAASKSLICW